MPYKQLIMHGRDVDGEGGGEGGGGERGENFSTNIPAASRHCLPTVAVPATQVNIFAPDGNEAGFISAREVDRRC